VQVTQTLFMIVIVHSNYYYKHYYEVIYLPFIWWGTRTKSNPLGQLQHHCPTCGKETVFTHYKLTNTWVIYSILPCWSSPAGEFIQCNVCGARYSYKSQAKTPTIISTDTVSTDRYRIEENVAVKSKKNDPLIAAIASFFIPGLGQLINGDSILKAILLFVGVFVGFLACIIPGIIIWAFGIFDAYSVAKTKMNLGEIPDKK
jgi:TM2 domain-containing membrane protein YozV